MKIAEKRAEKGLWWDRAWSLVEGCTPVSPGCDNCWSALQTFRRAGQTATAMKKRYKGLLTDDKEKYCGHEIKTIGFNGKIRLMWDDLKKPTPREKPATFAIWNDLFHEKVPIVFAVKAFERMYKCPQHIFIICTKRSSHMRTVTPLILAILKTKYPDAQIPLPNVIGMVTAENQEQADLRIPDLARSPYAIKAVNVEPMLEPLLMPEITVCLGCNRDIYERDCGCPAGTGKRFRYKIDWVLCGSETGSMRIFKTEWAKDLRDQSKKAGVPFWMKSKEFYTKVRELPVV